MPRLMSCTFQSPEMLHGLFMMKSLCSSEYTAPDDELFDWFVCRVFRHEERNRQQSKQDLLFCRWYEDRKHLQSTKDSTLSSRTIKMMSMVIVVDARWWAALGATLVKSALELEVLVNVL